MTWQLTIEPSDNGYIGRLAYPSVDPANPVAYVTKVFEQRAGVNDARKRTEEWVAQVLLGRAGTK